MPNYTTDDLLLYLYDELGTLEKEALKKELQTNWALREKLQVLRLSMQRLQTSILLKPRCQTIDAVMSYAEISLSISN